MAQFIFGIVVNVLRHVLVELRNCIRECRTATRGHSGITRNLLAGDLCDLIILDSSHFLVLQPKIAFDNLGGRKPAQNCSVAAGQVAFTGLGQGRRNAFENARSRYDSSREYAAAHESTAVKCLFRQGCHIFTGGLTRIRRCLILESNALHNATDFLCWDEFGGITRSDSPARSLSVRFEARVTLRSKLDQEFEKY